MLAQVVVSTSTVLNLIRVKYLIGDHQSVTFFASHASKADRITTWLPTEEMRLLSELNLSATRVTECLLSPRIGDLLSLHFMTFRAYVELDLIIFSFRLVELFDVASYVDLVFLFCVTMFS